MITTTLECNNKIKLYILLKQWDCFWSIILLRTTRKTEEDFREKYVYLKTGEGHQPHKDLWAWEDVQKDEPNS